MDSERGCEMDLCTGRVRVFRLREDAARAQSHRGLNRGEDGGNKFGRLLELEVDEISYAGAKMTACATWSDERNVIIGDQI